MFKCDNCKKITKPHEKLTKAAIKVRPMTYTEKGQPLSKSAKRWFGYEIVKEINLCESCAETMKEANKKRKQEFDRYKNNILGVFPKTKKGEI